MGKTRSARIAELNDTFRKKLPSGQGRVYVTAGVRGEGGAFIAKALAKVVAFDNFGEDNDPYGERDFGAFELDDHKLYWTIDYYDLKGEFGSEDPSKPTKTLRVLTIMLREEY